MQLKLFTLATLFIALTSAVALPGPFADSEDIAASGGGGCVNDGCKCSTSYAAGIYCGSCAAVTSCTGGSCLNNVYQCGNKNGKCCNYGYRKSCARNEGPCGN
jgi:hypothetical protein